MADQNIEDLCNKQPPEKITSIWNPVDLIPKSHDIVPFPLARELTLKCKKEAREGLGPWQMLCTWEARTLVEESGPGSLPSLALKEGWEEVTGTWAR